jgi:hypothetical protein
LLLLLLLWPALQLPTPWTVTPLLILRLLLLWPA